MNKLKKILPVINLILPIILLLLILFLDNAGERVFYVIYMTGIIGWVLPLFTIFVTGIVQLRKVHYKLALILNIISILLNIFILYFIIRLMSKELILMLTIYVITLLITICNIVYITNYIKKYISPEIKKENMRIKKEKKENNGVIK